MLRLKALLQLMKRQNVNAKVKLCYVSLYDVTSIHLNMTGSVLEFFKSVSIAQRSGHLCILADARKNCSLRDDVSLNLAAESSHSTSQLLPREVFLSPLQQYLAYFSSPLPLSSLMNVHTLENRFGLRSGT